MKPIPPWRPATGQKLFEDGLKTIASVKSFTKGVRGRGAEIADAMMEWVGVALNAAYAARNETELRVAVGTVRSVLANMPDALSWFQDEIKCHDKAESNTTTVKAPPPRRNGRRVRTGATNSEGTLFGLRLFNPEVQMETA